jgi:hypothetical protein
MAEKDPIEYVTKIDPELTPESGRITLSSPKAWERDKEAEAS